MSSLRILANHSKIRLFFCSIKTHMHSKYTYRKSSTTPPRKSLSKMLYRVPLAVGVGFGAFAGFQFYDNVLSCDTPRRCATRWELKTYELLPLRLWSRVAGYFSRLNLPLSIRTPIYKAYSTWFGVDLTECQNTDLTLFPTLSDFFIRLLKDECRPIDNDSNNLVSPADGTILSLGKIENCEIEQIKGVTYCIRDFLGKPSWCDKSDVEQQDYLAQLKTTKDSELYQFVVYLNPGDYHRFHSPVTWNVRFRRHFQQYLLSVNPKIVAWINGLFALNERVVYVGQWDGGFFSLTAIGATTVGSIDVYLDPELRTNQWRRQPSFKDQDFNFEHPITKGALFGDFKLGSCIVLIFEAPKDFSFKVKPGEKIKYGQSFGNFAVKKNKGFRFWGNAT